MQPEEQRQRQRQRREPEPDHLFKGIYIGDRPLTTHLEEIDPDSQIFPGARDYIDAFPFTREYFNRVYPFYNGSKVSEHTIFTIYDTSFTTFVEMFKLNHPDWSDYSDDECIQHFIEFISLNPDPTEYHIEQNDHEYEDHRFNYYTLNQTPPTHEKPHFHASEYIYSDGRFHEERIGYGYFRDVNDETVPFERQMGRWGPYGIRLFDLDNHISLIERYRQGQQDQDFEYSDSIHLRLSDGTPFDICIDHSQDKNHKRFIENDNDDFFLFEESFQNEKKERRLEKLRREREQQEEQEKMRQRWIDDEYEEFTNDEYEELFTDDEYYKEMTKLLQFQNRTSQKKIRNQKIEKELFESQLARWANLNASAYINHPATIEMAQKFSAPLEPFVYRNLPIPTALPHEYRNPVPIIDDE